MSQTHSFGAAYREQLLNIPPPRDGQPRPADPIRAEQDRAEVEAWDKIAWAYGPGPNHKDFDPAIHGVKLRVRESEEFARNVELWLEKLAEAGVVAGRS